MSSDLASVKRDLQHAEMAADDRRWDDIMSRIAKVQTSLAGLPEADAAPIAERTAALRERAEKAIREEKSEQIAKSIRRNISAADPSRQAPDRVAAHLDRATEMLEDDEAREFLLPETAAELRRLIAEKRGGSDDEERRRALDDLGPILAHLEQALAASPFTGLGPEEAGRLARDLAARVRGARGILERQPAHPDLDAPAASLSRLEARLDGCWQTWERDVAVARIEESWAHVQREIAGWRDEPDAMTWAQLTFDLGLPLTVRAVRACGHWQTDSLIEEAKERHAADPAVRHLVAEVAETGRQAAARLHAAFERLLADGERAPLPTEHRELEQTAAIAASASAWFEGTPYLDVNVARARDLQARWKANVDELDRLGLELYHQLAAEAEVAWGRIVAELPAETAFDPRDPTPRTIRLDRIYNRARWDFDGSQDFALRVNGVAVAGDYGPGIGPALGDASRRTRQPISQHIEWDVIAVVEGPGTVKVRTTRELLVKETNAKMTLESWEPEPCLRVRIVALHAGPVAVVQVA